MARGGSGIGTILGLGVAGVGVYWVGNMFGWWGGSTTVTATPPTSGIIPSGTPMPTNPPPPATVTLNGTVSLVANNALKASFTINGVTQNIAVIPNGDAYNDAGQDITSTLATQGVTPAQLYTLMSAKYSPASPNATQSSNPPQTFDQALSIMGGNTLGGAGNSLGGSFFLPPQSSNTQGSNANPSPALSALLTKFASALSAYNSAGPFAKPGLVAVLTVLSIQIKNAGGVVPSNPVGLSGVRTNYVRRGAAY